MGQADATEASREEGSSELGGSKRLVLKVRIEAKATHSPPSHKCIALGKTLEELYWAMMQVEKQEARAWWM